MQQGLTSAFVNHQVEANLAFKPQFVSNNYKEGRKVLTTIEEELLRCEEFSISVAFITKGGLVSLLQTLKELESRGIRGRILTTDYQTFTDPGALDKLYELDNIELKMYYTEGTEEYLDGKPDYADQFVNNQTFMWDSQMGKGPDSSYMQDVKEAMHKHLFIKKSDAEGSDFYYMGEFDIVHIQSDKKKDKNGKLKDIAKVELKMHDLVREDLFKYLTTPTQES